MKLGAAQWENPLKTVIGVLGSTFSGIGTWRFGAQVRTTLRDVWAIWRRLSFNVFTVYFVDTQLIFQQDYE